MKSGNNLETVKDKWMKMVETLANRDDATKFIRYFWNSQHKFIREKGLYKQVCAEVNSHNCETFVASLATMAELYNAIDRPEDFRFFNSNEINDILVQLSTMNVKIFYPIVFALVLKGYDEDDIYKLLKAIEVLAFRNFVVAGFNSNRYEVIFAQIAYSLSHEEYMVDDALQAIRENTLDDEKFIHSLHGLEIRAVPIAKYVLRELEDYQCPEKKTARNNKTINLEHIMPKNNGVWKVPDEIHSRYLYRLANQTIMLEEYNKSASNKLFSVKKENYKKSAIKMTQDLLKYQEWGVEQLQEREAELIEIILKRWAMV